MEVGIETANKVQAVVSFVAFPLSAIGTILNLVFICRKKTNFILRVFVYTAIAVTALHAVCVPYGVLAWPYVICGDSCINALVYVYFGGVPVAAWTVGVFGCVIPITILLKLWNPHCLQRQINPHLQRFLEVLFIVMTILLPLLALIPVFTTWPNGPQPNLNLNLVLPVSSSVVGIALFLSLASDVLLVCWFCARRRQLQRRRAVVLKEVLLFLLLLAVTLLVGVFSGMVLAVQFQPHTNSHDFVIFLTIIVVIQTCAQILLIFYPFCLFAYMCVSFRQRNRNPQAEIRQDFQTAGLQTTPPSTRVSLPTDTAAHAPNFLSPSTAEPSEVTPLIN